MRKVEPTEYPSLISAMQKYLDVVQYRKYAQMYYPPSVVKFACSVEGEYNDEGGTDYRIDAVTAYDASGEVIDSYLEDPDVTEELLAFQVFKANELRRIPDIYAKYGPPNLATWEDSECDVRHSLPLQNDSYDFTVELDLPHQPIVYVEG